MSGLTDEQREALELAGLSVRSHYWNLISGTIATLLAAARAEGAEKARAEDACTTTAVEHRWLWFGANGERDEFHVPYPVAGQVTVPIDELEKLLRRAGFKLHDPDQVEQAAQRRKFRALERLRDGLMESLNGRAR